MSTVNFLWAENPRTERRMWKKPILPLADRLKKAEANLQRRLKKIRR